MPKLYVAKLIILRPIDLRDTRNEIESYESEDILVRRTPFGYQEVFTKFNLKKKHVLEKNQNGDNDRFKYRICDSSIAAQLRVGKKCFVLDEDRSFPLREATEKDAKEYIDRFETTAIKKHLDSEEEKRKAKEKEAYERKQTQGKAKQLVKYYQAQQKKKD